MTPCSLLPSSLNHLSTFVLAFAYFLEHLNLFCCVPMNSSLCLLTYGCLNLKELPGNPAPGQRAAREDKEKTGEDRT